MTLIPSTAPSSNHSLYARSAVVILLLLALFSFYIGQNPEYALFLYPIYIPIILLSVLMQKLTAPRHSFKLGFIALLFPVLIAFIIRNELQPIEKFAAFIYITATALALKIGYSFFSRATNKIIEHKERIEEIEEQLTSIVQENNFYSDRVANLKTKIGARQMLSSFTREMGTLMEPDSIQMKLIEKVQHTYPDAQVSLRTSNFSEDPADSWVAEKKAPLLVKEMGSDTRFPAINSDISSARSAIAVPLIIERNMIGIIRVDSSVPKRFTEMDIQQLELYTHLSILGLENAHLFSKVNAMATKDALTSLATHRVFQERLTEEILRAARYHNPLSLLMLDIDHFKQVNDTYGHLTGDMVLKEVSQIITRYCRNVDFPARYGGEEFTVILPQTDLGRSFEFAENIRRVIEETRMSSSAGAFNVSLSIGCASFPQDAQISSQLIRKADERLYRAKSFGRNRVVAE